MRVSPILLACLLASGAAVDGGGRSRKASAGAVAPPLYEPSLRSKGHPSAAAGPAHFALLLHGRVGSIGLPASESIRKMQGKSRRLVTLSALSHLSNVVRANEADGGVDVHVHSWNPELAPLIDELYGASLRSSSHEPVETRQKARSQAISIGRGAAQIAWHEHERQLTYTLVLVMRLDLVLAAPVRLRAFSPDHVWFSARCCAQPASTEQHRSAVEATCGPLERNTGPWRDAARDLLLGTHARGQGPKWGTDKRVDSRRVMGFCRPNYHGNVKSSHPLATQGEAYVLHDWWFAARTHVVSSWLDIDRNWEQYVSTFVAAGVRDLWSHHIWAMHVHDILNLTSAVRFSADVRGQIGRNAWVRLEHLRRGKGVPRGVGKPYDNNNPVVTYLAEDGPHQLMEPAGNAYTDAVGICPAFRRLGGGPEVSPKDLLPRPIERDADGRYLGLFSERFAPMAAQCAEARLPQLVVCCGAPRICAVQICPAEDRGGLSSLEKHHRSARQVVDYTRNDSAIVSLLLHRVELGSLGPGNSSGEIGRSKAAAGAAGKKHPRRGRTREEPHRMKRAAGHTLEA